MQEFMKDLEIQQTIQNLKNDQQIQESDLQMFGLLETKEAIYLSKKVNINFF